METEDEEVEDEGREVEEETFSARTGPCLGCPTELSTSSPETQELAQYALSTLQSALNSQRIQSIARIVKATSQVTN